MDLGQAVRRGKDAWPVDALTTVLLLIVPVALIAWLEWSGRREIRRRQALDNEYLDRLDAILRANRADANQILSSVFIEALRRRQFIMRDRKDSES